MSSELFNRFAPVICAGLALVLVGVVNLLLVRRGLRVRVPATVAALGLAAGAVAALGLPELLASAARLTAVVLLPCLILAYRPVSDRLGAGIAVLQRPRVGFALVTGAGFATAVGAGVSFERAEREAMTAATTELEIMQGTVRTVPNPELHATTDRGTPIVMRGVVNMTPADLREFEDRLLRGALLHDQVIRRGPPDERSNCHGWVFTGGRSQLSQDDVELILKENGYQDVRDPSPGDVVIYRHSGSISHTAVVRYVTEGQPVLVEGKWARFGVFLHPIDKCIYGPNYTFYRSNRHGHLLAGLSGPDRSEGQSPSMPAE